MHKTVDALAIIDTLIAIQDKHTIAHSNRVSKYCYVFGRYLDLSAHALKAVTLAGYLHDVGKVAIDEDLLSKKDITPEEKMLITQHSIESANIVADTLGLPGISNIILTHHERWDGEGYPLGLRSTQIPYLSRILSIVDCFDALSSRRQYKEPFPKEKVVEIMLNSSGQFDPLLLDRFISLTDKIKKESVNVSLVKIL